MNAITKVEQGAVQLAPVSGPIAAALQVLQAGMTIEQMQGLMTLQKDWEANEARKQYVDDMAEFKKDPPKIYKTKSVAYSGTAFNHATIGDVATAITEGLAKYGFSHRWDTTQEGGQVKVTCTITHRLGHSERTTLETSPDDTGKKNKIQAIASAVTYLQRYTLLAATGMATNDLPDDDGRAYGEAEGFTSSPSYNGEEVLARWTDIATRAPNLERLNECRKAGAQELNAGKDVAGWNAFKAVIEARRNELTTTEGNAV